MWKPCPLTGESSEEERGEVTVQGEEGSIMIERESIPVGNPGALFPLEGLRKNPP